MSKELVQIAQELDDPLLQAVALRAEGLTFRALGEFTAAFTKLQQALDLYQSATASAQPELPFYNTEVASSLSNSAFVLCMLGYADQARVLMTKAIGTVEGQASAFSLSSIITLAAHLYRIIGDIDRVGDLSQRLLMLDSQYELPQSIWEGTYYRGWVQVRQGDLAGGIPQVEQGIDGFRQVGFTMFQTYRLGMLADLYLQADQPDAAEAALQEALVISAQCHERIWDAELHRLCGNLAQARAEPKAKIEHYYLRAIEVARNQEAKTLELRAAATLARLWQKQGKRQQARELLATIYDWFTEGFNTADLVEARALLDELS